MTQSVRRDEFVRRAPLERGGDRRVRLLSVDKPRRENKRCWPQRSFFSVRGLSTLKSRTLWRSPPRSICPHDSSRGTFGRERREDQNGPAIDRLNPRDFDDDGRGQIDHPETPHFVPNEFGAGIVAAPLANSDQRFILTNYHVVLVCAGDRRLVETGREPDLRAFRRSPRLLCGSSRWTLAATSPSCRSIMLRCNKPSDACLDSAPDLERTDQRGNRSWRWEIPYAIARDGSPSASWGIINNIARRPAPVRQRETGVPRSETIHEWHAAAGRYANWSLAPAECSSTLSRRARGGHDVAGGA